LTSQSISIRILFYDKQKDFKTSFCYLERKKWLKEKTIFLSVNVIKKRVKNKRGKKLKRLMKQIAVLSIVVVGLMGLNLYSEPGVKEVKQSVSGKWTKVQIPGMGGFDKPTRGYNSSLYITRSGDIIQHSLALYSYTMTGDQIGLKLKSNYSGDEIPGLHQLALVDSGNTAVSSFYSNWLKAFYLDDNRRSVLKLDGLDKIVGGPLRIVTIAPGQYLIIGQNTSEGDIYIYHFEGTFGEPYKKAAGGQIKATWWWNYSDIGARRQI
jgi:hypothetical protein